MIRVLWLAALLSSACVSPSSVACGQYVCAADEVCTPGGCATQADVDACSGLAEGAACMTTSGHGACQSGACRIAICGNGVVEGTEVCDGDGTVNASAGEHCSSDCLHIEVCGNSVVDPGEQCDDGNSNPADGCNACQLTTWQVSTLLGDNVNATTVPLGYIPAITVDGLGAALFVAGTQLLRLDAQGALTVIAGTPYASTDSGDGGPATSATFQGIAAVTVDDLGNIYIVDATRIRRIDARGIVTTIAGNGISAPATDNVAAVSTSLEFPGGTAVDGLGNMYVSEQGTYKIKRIDPHGILTTYAGTGAATDGGDGGPAIAASFHDVSRLAVDSHGGLAVLEGGARKVRYIAPDGTISTIVGTGVQGSGGDGGPATAAQLDNPRDVQYDANDALYIADAGSNKVRRVANGVISTVAGTGVAGYTGDGGAAVSAELEGPTSATVNGAGELFIADQVAIVRRVDAAGTISTVAGTTYTPLAMTAFWPRTSGLSSSKVAIDHATGVYYGTEATVIFRVDTGGALPVRTVIAGQPTAGFSGDGGPAIAAAVNAPNELIVDHQHRIVFYDAGNHRIRRIDASGIITTIAGTGASGYSGDGGLATSATFSDVFAFAVDAADNVYFADAGNYRIREIDGAGIITTVAGSGTQGYSGDGGQAKNARIGIVKGLAVDAQSNLYLSDTFNNRIRRVSGTTISTFAGNGTVGCAGDNGQATSAQLAEPGALAFDPQGRLLVVQEHWEQTIPCTKLRRIDTSGVITTIAGDGTPDESGDGGPLANARVDAATDIAFDDQGRLVVMSARTRRVEASGKIFTLYGAIDPASTGPLSTALLTNPTALVAAAGTTLFGSGITRTVQAIRNNALIAVVGKYPQLQPTGNLARFQSTTFGQVSGLAFDGVQTLYVSEVDPGSAYARVDAVTMVDPNDETTWTLRALNANTSAGFADGSSSIARFRDPAGLFDDTGTHTLYVADAGNHVIRAIDTTTSAVTTIAGTPMELGVRGDGGPATAANLNGPRGVVRCSNGDIFIADTDNHRVRRIDASGTISTVLGDGTPASSGEGAPSSIFPVDTPTGIACDALGNVVVTSRSTLRLLASDATGHVDGTGEVVTIYGRSPVTTFPETVTRCLTAVAIIDPSTLQALDACTGIWVQVQRN